MSEVLNPSIGAAADRPRARFRVSVRKMMLIVLALGCFFAVVARLNQLIGAAKEAANCAQCTGHFKQIALALHNYHSVYGCLPPAFVADASGKPMHSWRLLILPFLSETALYSSYDFSEPWNGPNNSKLLKLRPASFGCPSRIHSSDSLTNYVAITGPGTMFSGSAPARFDQITDGAANSLMVVEVAKLAIPWTAPVDLDVTTMSFRVNDVKLPGISSMHTRGANVVYGDGHCTFMRESIAPSELKALTTIAGGEAVLADDVDRQR
jgi:prepilin-type processing-associated H-X9-DG protein